MNRQEINEFKARLGELAGKMAKRVRTDPISITEAEILIEVAFRKIFNAGLLAACNTTDQIMPYDDIRRVSKVIKTDLMDEDVVGRVGPPAF